jgi:hypothetical protein
MSSGPARRGIDARLVDSDWPWRLSQASLGAQDELGAAQK